MKLDPQTVRNTGLSHARAQLSNRGWKVVPPTRDAKGLDFLVYTQDASRKLSIKVRTLSRRKAVSLRAHHGRKGSTIPPLAVARWQFSPCRVTSPDEYLGAYPVRSYLRRAGIVVI
jgi:hypothetical protein